MAKRYYSREGLFGGKEYFDESGKRVGYSREGLFGGTEYFDESGKRVGYSREGLFGGTEILDEKCNRLGFSHEGIFGGQVFYDSSRKFLGSSHSGLLGGKVINLNGDGLFSRKKDDSGVEYSLLSGEDAGKKYARPPARKITTVSQKLVPPAAERDISEEMDRLFSEWEIESRKTKPGEPSEPDGSVVFDEAIDYHAFDSEISVDVPAPPETGVPEKDISGEMERLFSEWGIEPRKTKPGRDPSETRNSRPVVRETAPVSKARAPMKDGGPSEPDGSFVFDEVIDDHAFDSEMND